MRFYFIRDEKSFPVACIASTIDTTDRVCYALSIYNPKDEFDRARARDIAANRLRKGKFFGTTPNVRGIKERVMMSIRDNSGIPERVREAARLWLSKATTGASSQADGHAD